VTPKANRDPVAIEIIANLSGAEAIHPKRNDACLFFRGADDEGRSPPLFYIRAKVKVLNKRTPA
jgi:hypothetical protein